MVVVIMRRKMKVRYHQSHIVVVRNPSQIPPESHCGSQEDNGIQVPPESHRGSGEDNGSLIPPESHCGSNHEEENGSLIPPESYVVVRKTMSVSMVMAIHRCGWVHGDLKPSNLLICDQDQLKAIDYGLANEVVNDQCIVPAAGGTLLWNIPPERINGACDLVKSTVWSVGVIYYCMVFGKLPFASLRKAKDRPLRWHHNISSGAKFMLQRLLDPEPNRRVAIEDLEQLIQTNFEIIDSIFYYYVIEEYNARWVANHCFPSENDK
ncbi:protein kinase domain-containing protein [Apostichopus japonicus]|uniref:Protein kinase domain-containing protein n=1 Tax=Stichopus japonicus TaxID=307972 RepID=A0A2G8JTI1_STIJA|nr:protein kinase domain-containing protein [Apostichopus japonicus]